MLSELCAECKNYFLRDYVRPEQYIHEGYFTITNGAIQPLPFLKNGQYFRILGSTFNDGVWKYGDQTTRLVDETFSGVIWEMFVPPAFVALAGKVKQWVTNNASTINSPYQSESFGGYSYSKAITGDGQSTADWRFQFAGELKLYRRLQEV